MVRLPGAVDDDHARETFELVDGGDGVRVVEVVPQLGELPEG